MPPTRPPPTTHVLALLLVCSALAHHTAADCLNPYRNVEEREDLSNCEWYEEATCCIAGDTNEITSELNRIEASCDKLPQKCIDYYNLYLCRVCSPAEDTHYNGMCKGFCEDFERACRRAECAHSETSESFGCDQLKSRNCFNGGSVVVPRGVYVVVVVGVVVGMFVGVG